MTDISKAFERRVERIHRLLETEDAKVTWNDRVPDPDNLAQPRQIDVTIRRPESTTIVECRIHEGPQDVTWIEELIGRRVSLRADAVIAVSNSGFTRGAEAKAAQFGVILRDFTSLTQEEIQSWGKRRNVHLTFYEFTDIVFAFRLPAFPAGPFVISDERGHAIKWRGMFEQAMKKLESDCQLRQLEGGMHFQTDVDAPILVDGVGPLSMLLTCHVRRIERPVSLSSLVAYADPLDQYAPTKAHVGELELGISEIVETSDCVSLVVDLSGVQIPENCLFRSISYDFGRIVQIRGVKAIGARDALIFENAISFRFEVT